ncbi:MAG: hypothetical protein JWQ09_5555 [Segetibacter sp.]|nr:hypothetical protein [Segetibacter sp.]
MVVIYLKHQGLIDLYEGICNSQNGCSKEFIQSFIKTIKKIQSVESLNQLGNYDGLNYQKLKGKQRGLSALLVNKKYQLLFKEAVSDVEPFETLSITVEDFIILYN